MKAARPLGWAAVLATPLLVHLALATGRHVPVALALAAIQLALGAVLAMRRWRWARFCLAPALAFIALLVWALPTWCAPDEVLKLQSGLSHGAIYGGLLILFGRSLRPGRQPLVTALAARISGPLCARRLAYTRRVTQAWCLFCVCQLATSATLCAFAPAETWSLFVNVLDLPLLCLMFAGEYALRCWLFRGERHASLGDGIRAFARRNAATGDAR
ncbi:MAG TPA: hypothetical protein VGH36_10815 [Acetobacteraceae bacterium]|jgi:uncharacterized membrane protein